MTALNRAFALAEREHTAVGIAQHLHLDVSRRGDQLLEVERAVAERRQSLTARALERVVEVIGSLDQAHSLPTAARGCLQQHRIADLGGCLGRFIGSDGFGARHQRQPGRCQFSLGLDLVAHARHHVCVGADEDEVVVLARADEVRVLGQEAVARMDGLATGRLAGRHDRGDVEVALGCRGRSDADGPVCETRRKRSGVRSRVDGDGLDTELVQRADHPHRDLAAVGNEHAREHR